MNVLHVIDSGGLYGAEVVLLNLMMAQRELGLTPKLLSIGTPTAGTKAIEKRAEQLGLHVQPIRFKAGLNVAGAREIFRYATQQGTDLLHSHGYKGNILLGLLPFHFRKLPMVSTLHGWTWTGQLNRMMVYEWLDRLSLNFIDRVIAVNPEMNHHKRLKGLPANRKAVIRNGIQIDRIRESSNATIENDIRRFIEKRFTIVAVGRFSSEKNYAALLRTLAKLIAQRVDVQLLLLGDGGLKQHHADLIAELGINERVLMPGYVDNVAAILKHCQLFAMPSLTEGLPIAMLEAMAVEIPIVSSRVGGIPEALEQGAGGILIPPGDDEALLGAIMETLEDYETALSRAKRAYKYLEGNYSNYEMARSYLDVYNQVLRLR